MTIHRITVMPHNPITAKPSFDISGIQAIHASRVYFVEGDLATDQLVEIAETLCADDVTEQYLLGDLGLRYKHLVEVTLQAGVTDPTAESLLRAIHQLGMTHVRATATAQRYDIVGSPTPTDLETLASKILSNNVIQRYSIDKPIDPPFIQTQEGDGTVEHIELRGLGNDDLLALSKSRRLSLDLAEMQAIQAYYGTENRAANDIELEMLAQTWSEHCVHKTFRATVDFRNEHGQQEIIHGLLKTYIRAATDKLNKSWVVSAFVDNAGIVRFDEQFDLAFKVETHNHPSALEPFGGANTGVGGVVRDVLGVSAKPIANTDILCFGYINMDEADLPEGVLHPKRIESGVIAGIEDYGNKMGIPTVNGAIVYNAGYTANPLVFCGCLGILPRGSHRTQAQAGDAIVVIGGRTGRDGLRGATFSSMEMDTTTSEIASISVQIGHPINEKQVQEVILKARDEGLYTAITDCGAGGLSSAVGEMGKDLGAEVELTHVTLKYPGLRPWEIWLSEAQERMVLAVPHDHLARFQQVCDGQNVEMVVIGTFNTSGKLNLCYRHDLVGTLDMHFLHEGIPMRHLKAHWERPIQIPSPTETPDYKDALLRLLAHPNIRSKESTVRLYDHEVQGGTVVKPFGGIGEHSPNDGAVIVPLATQHTPDSEGRVRGVALSNGICPQYGHDDPYAMAWAAVDEAFRNLVAIGANPEQVAILDNFCWGNPNLPDRLGTLVMTSKGCHDAALAYGAPFISGKDSLNNEYADENGTRHAIPGTLLISAMGIVPDVQRTTSSDFKKPTDAIFLVGSTHDELGQSHYHQVQKLRGGVVPQPTTDPMPLLRALHHAIQKGYVNACHDLSEGGLAVALAEMCIGGDTGAQIHLSRDARIQLFSESNTRFVVSVPSQHLQKFEHVFNQLPVTRLGVVVAEKTLRVTHQESPLLDCSLSELRQAWGTPHYDDSVQTAVTVRSKKSGSTRVATPKTTRPRALIMHANGSNRDHDAALALTLAGAEPEIVHLNQLASREKSLSDYQILVIPGGFSYGDDLGAGQLWATDLRHYFHDDLETFVAEGRPVLGICNGFQALIKAGLLPDTDFASSKTRRSTLTYNAIGHFECRWVRLQPTPHSNSLFTDNVTEAIYCPVAHGEGNVVARNTEALHALWAEGCVALQYTDENGALAGYPYNPNGSQWNIAALTNAAGNVMGLMPHPENHVFAWQHPRYHRGEHGQSGLVLFENAVKFA